MAAKRKRKSPPRALNADVVDTLEDAFRSGMTVRLACGRAGIGRASFHRWMARGADLSEATDTDIVQTPEPHEALYLDLYLRCEQALAECAHEHLDRLRLREPGRWQADAWVLERRFGYRQSMEIEQHGTERQDEETREGIRALAVLEGMRQQADDLTAELASAASGVDVV